MDVNALFTKMQKALHELRRNAQKRKLLASNASPFKKILRAVESISLLREFNECEIYIE